MKESDQCAQFSVTSGSMICKKGGFVVTTDKYTAGISCQINCQSGYRAVGNTSVSVTVSPLQSFSVKITDKSLTVTKKLLVPYHLVLLVFCQCLIIALSVFCQFLVMTLPRPPPPGYNMSENRVVVTVLLPILCCLPTSRQTTRGDNIYLRYLLLHQHRAADQNAECCNHLSNSSSTDLMSQGQVL